MADPVTIGLGLGALALNWWLGTRGMQEQRKANESAQEFNLDLFKKASAMELKQARETMAWETEENKKERQYKGYQNFLDRFSTILNTKPQMTQNLIAIQRGRR